MKKLTTKKLTLYGLFIALVTVSTIILVFPTFFTKGYVNMGDTMVLFAAYLFGGIPGMIIGGIGSALADAILGYYVYVPITLIVKGLEGLLAGKLFTSLHQSKRATIPISYFGGLLMIGGYFVFEIYLYGFEAALASTAGNLIQAVSSATAAWILYFAIGDRIRQQLNRL